MLERRLGVSIPTIFENPAISAGNGQSTTGGATGAPSEEAGNPDSGGS